MRCSDVWRIFVGRQFWQGPAPWIAVLLIAANMVVARGRSNLSAERRENLTTGDVKADAPAVRERRHDSTYGENLLETWPAIPDATQKPLIVLCGMSQLHTINDRQPGDQLTCEEMDDALAPKGARVFGLHAPNLSNEEALFLALALIQQPQTTPRVFIFGSCFDKFRNIDLRPGYRNFLRARPDLQAAWKRLAEERRADYPQAAAKMVQSLEEIQSEEKQLADDSVEGRLREAVASVVPVVAARKDLNAAVQLRLYNLRNQALGIKSSSKRPILQSRYDMNREFLRLTMDVLARSGVRFATYVIPLNPQAESPYVADEYAAFKVWLQEETARRKVPFANLENLVPDEEWGEWMGGPDFKHFKGAAHRRTAAKLIEQFGPLAFEANERP
jgi:hypothetical protein